MKYWQNRYPGIRSFEASEQELFFGRSEEIRSLYAQVKILDIVVLFSKSGIGKSSLINAGLIPLLELEPVIPLKVRFQDTSISPVEAVKNVLRSYIDPNTLQKHSEKTLAEAGLWECLRACRFERYGESAVPVLFFDQFEEFFDHSEELKRQFIVDLADMVSKRLPNRVRDHLLSIPVEQRSTGDMEWHQPIVVKIVIAIRSDRLSLLDDLSIEMPLILHNRFQLKPLQSSQAREAITKPAALPDAGFGSKPFVFQEQTLTLILNELTNNYQEIESFQLQLICQYIEQQVLLRQNDYVGQRLEVDQSFVGGKDDIQSIINDYYERAIEALPDEYEELARNFIETGLIVGGRRVGVIEGVEKERYGVNAELLSLLVESRLVRPENTHLGRSYEVSHDALVTPILKSYEIRRQRMEAEEAERVRKEQEHRLAEELRVQHLQLTYERRMRRRSLVFATIAGILAIVTTIALFIATNALDVAEKQKDDAEFQNERALDALKKYQEAELRLLSTKVDVYMTANQPSMALTELERVRKDTLLKLTEFPPDLAKKEADAIEMEKHLTKNK